MKHRVLSRSIGILSGKEPGDTVDVKDQHDATHLIGLGLIEPVTGPKETPKGGPKETKGGADAAPKPTGGRKS